MTINKKAREFWVSDSMLAYTPEEFATESKTFPSLKDSIHVIEYSAYEALREENESLSVKLQRTVSAAYHALLETTAWMGIPEKKRESRITEAMSNVKYCAEHDLRHVDESQAVNSLRDELTKLKAKAEMLREIRRYAKHSLTCDCFSMKAECSCGFAKLISEYDKQE